MKPQWIVAETCEISMVMEYHIIHLGFGSVIGGKLGN
jgi:hypothetical protein